MATQCTNWLSGALWLLVLCVFTWFFICTETVLLSQRSLYEVLSVNAECPKYFVFELLNPLICRNNMPTRCNRCFLLQILLLAQHVSGTIIPIIRSSRVLYSWLQPVVFGAWFSSCRYGVELRVVCPQLHTIKKHLLHLVDVLFPHINDDARSKSLQIYWTHVLLNFVLWACIKIVRRFILCLHHPTINLVHTNIKRSFPTSLKNGQCYKNFQML
jgi:hypothetical protein